jgi:hypothetical protein
MASLISKNMNNPNKSVMGHDIHSYCKRLKPDNYYLNKCSDVFSCDMIFIDTLMSKNFWDEKEIGINKEYYRTDSNGKTINEHRRNI